MLWLGDRPRCRRQGSRRHRRRHRRRRRHHTCANLNTLAHTRMQTRACPGHYAQVPVRTIRNITQYPVSTHQYPPVPAGTRRCRFPQHSMSHTRLVPAPTHRCHFAQNSISHSTRSVPASTRRCRLARDSIAHSSRSVLASTHRYHFAPYGIPHSTRSVPTSTRQYPPVPVGTAWHITAFHTPGQYPPVPAVPLLTKLHLTQYPVSTRRRHRRRGAGEAVSKGLQSCLTRHAISSGYAAKAGTCS